MILIIDNYDSFTYNVYQSIAALGCEVKVARNDCITLEQIEDMKCSALIISPGPGTPDDAGISKEVIRHFAATTPILGICLGHQAIGEVFGAKVVRAPRPVHGKTSHIRHTGYGLYRGMPQMFTAGRYHSLIVDKTRIPDCLEITATSEDGLIMGLKHKVFEVEGVQFHPESILTPDGTGLLNNFITRYC
jgi:anthranilate synthase component 2